MPMSDLDGLRVGVVGAGIGGAATALLLGARGADVTVFERVAEPRAVGAGIALQPNGLAVLYGLGLRDALREGSFAGHRGQILRADGRKVLGTELPDFGRGLDHYLVLRRAHLLSVLVDALDAAPGVTTRFGTDVDAVDAGGIVHTTGGDAIGFDLVVAADGVHSRARDALGIGAVCQTGVRYLRGLIDERVGTETTETWTPLGLFGRAPVGDGTYFFCGTASAPVRDALERHDLDALAAAWTVAFPPARELFDGVAGFDDLLVNEVLTVDCPAFHSGVVALLGDAAHAMAPNTGQGANSALVDAAVLVDELRRAESVGAGLRAYTARRRPKVRAVQRLSMRLARLAGIRSPAARRVRDLVLSATAGLSTGRRGLDRIMQEDPARLLEIASLR